ncbi:hypothetical protein EZS27_005808 [termite gut metagenome]|uniref:Uncharacterized protein n=1 Tax=termite gut metagenome TaxID=433724 RepID=A0A5J4SMM9_9ZZZZ
MKRIAFSLFLFGLIAGSNVCMAALSNSKIRKEARFLTDKMAHELSLNMIQYNDVYEINYDFIFSVNRIMDDAVKGNTRALDRYYQNLDIRNDDLRWVLSDRQYRRFLNIDYFYRPIYAGGNKWHFRVYIAYTNHSLFYLGEPNGYKTYHGGHYRGSHTHTSHYKDKHNHAHYDGAYSVKSEHVYHNNRRSDFGSRDAESKNKKGSRNDRR